MRSRSRSPSHRRSRSRGWSRSHGRPGSGGRLRSRCRRSLGSGLHFGDQPESDGAERSCEQSGPEHALVTFRRTPVRLESHPPSTHSPVHDHQRAGRIACAGIGDAQHFAPQPRGERTPQPIGFDPERARLDHGDDRTPRFDRLSRQRARNRGRRPEYEPQNERGRQRSNHPISVEKGPARRQSCEPASLLWLVLEPNETASSRNERRFAAVCSVRSPANPPSRHGRSGSAGNPAARHRQTLVRWAPSVLSPTPSQT